MTSNRKIIDKRVSEAGSALIADLKLSEDESEVREFIEHHLDELEEEYWLKEFDEAKPSLDLVASRLTVSPFWMEEALEGDADLDRVDFTLPGEVTDYLLCVEYTEEGELSGISMES